MVRDAYFGLGHTNLIGQLENCNGFIQKCSYPNQQSTLDSEWGTVKKNAAVKSLVIDLECLTVSSKVNKGQAKAA